MNVNPKEAKIKTLFLGDSYTNGDGAPKEESWPVRLVERLKLQGFQIESTTVATGGWTTFNLDRGMIAANLQPTYNLITLFIGTNDQYQNVSLEGFEKRLDQLISRCLALSGNRPDHIVLIQSPDYSVTPSVTLTGQNQLQIRKELEELNSIIAEKAEAYGTKLTSMWELSKEMQFDTSLVSYDQLHPSGKMHEKWANHLFPIALEILSGGK